MKAMPDRIWKKFEMGPDCWEWTARRESDGYGRVKLDGRMRMAHRVVYEHLKAPIPEGLGIDHLCRNRGCVRPSHLEPVTQRENVQRGAATIYSEDRAECPRCGTEMFKGAARHTTRGWQWRCRACKAEYDRRSRALKRAMEDSDENAH